MIEFTQLKKALTVTTLINKILYLGIKRSGPDIKKELEIYQISKLHYHSKTQKVAAFRHQ